jgi:dUTP pyrophosphatase
LKIKIKKLHIDAKIPAYQTNGAVGFDLSSVSYMTIRSGESALVPTGLSIELPKGYELQVRPRSGLALKHSITVLNSPGTVDSDYRGELKVILINHGKNDLLIAVGERIAQGIINKVELVDFDEVEELSDTDRGISGFGSTGKV